MKSNKKDKVSRSDWRFMEQNPHGDPGFNPEHNARVIAEVDAWNDQMNRKRDRDFKEAAAERTNAITQYFKNVSQGRAVNGVEQYFGKRYLAYLRGEEVVRQLRANPALVEKLKNKMAGQGPLQPL